MKFRIQMRPSGSAIWMVEGSYALYDEIEIALKSALGGVIRAKTKADYDAATVIECPFGHLVLVWDGEFMDIVRGKKNPVKLVDVYEKLCRSELFEAYIP